MSWLGARIRQEYKFLEIKSIRTLSLSLLYALA